MLEVQRSRWKGDDGQIRGAVAPHSSTLAWKIPWTEEPGGLQSMGLLRVRQDWVTSLSLFTFMHWRRKWQPTSVFLPGESQTGEPGGLPSMGSHRVGHDWSNLAAAASRCYLSSHENPVRYVVTQNFRSSGRLNQIIWGFLATKWYSNATVLLLYIMVVFDVFESLCMKYFLKH